MRSFVNKLLVLEREISSQRGDFALFALFLREDVPDKWDLVVAAPWFGADDRKTLDYLSQKIRSRLKPQELLTISRIVVVGPSDPSVKAIQRVLSVEHGAAEFKNCNFFGLQIKQAYIITSKRAAGEPKPATT